MTWKDLNQEPGPVARTVSVSGDRRAPRVLRDGHPGLRRFEGLQPGPGIVRPMRVDRLRMRVAAGVPRRTPCQAAPPPRSRGRTDRPGPA